MHTIELLEQALALAASLGYRVRQEWLNGSGGGRCEVRGQRLLFVDLALTHAEQFAQVAEALIGEPRVISSLQIAADDSELGQSKNEEVAPSIPISIELHQALALRKSA